MASLMSTRVPDDVVAAYLEPHRRYHTLEHIYNGLRIIARLCEVDNIDKTARALIECAWWHHDVVYQPGASDNEKRSADWAVGNVPTSFAPMVREMIMATIYPEPTRLVHPYIAVIQDADLYGLSQPAAVFDHHTEQVRAEFGYLSDEEWRVGRLRFWDTLLNGQQPIYKTKYAQEMWGHEAISNIIRERTRLMSEAPWAATT